MSEPLPEEGDPAGDFPLKAPSLAEMIREAREFVAAEVPFGALAQALRTADAGDPADTGDPADELMRVTPDTAATARLVLETLTWFARHRAADPYGAAIPSRLAADTAVDALLHALVPPRYLKERP